jgi:hypothetical protein
LWQALDNPQNLWDTRVVKFTNHSEVLEMVKTDAGRAFVGSDCTLDGQRAIVIGRALDFGTIATLPDGPRYEYAWLTIARVMESGGAFKS